jgi:uncharacterized membrane protein YedE/YeeE
VKSTSNRAVVAGVSGLLFGLGLAVSGMSKPEKVIGFLDLFGSWDPTLMLVMAGAVAVHFVAYRLVKKQSSPLFGERFAIPTRRDIDVKLVAGSALFGAGWGLGGFCPGPGLVSSASGGASALVFIGAMLPAMYATSRMETLFAARRARREAFSERQDVSVTTA